jgi:hypothetical protein
MVQNFRENDAIVSALSGSLREGKTSLAQAPKLLKKILKEGRWKKRVITQTGQSIEFERFEDFVTAEPLEGLGLTIDMIRRICGDDVEALDLLDKTLRRKHGGSRKVSKVKNDNIILEKTKLGTSRAYALSKLHKSKPDLHAKVLAGELTPNEAMIKAGFRVKTITIPLEPKKAAQALARHFKKSGLWKELLEQIKSVK